MRSGELAVRRPAFSLDASVAEVAAARPWTVSWSARAARMLNRLTREAAAGVGSGWVQAVGLALGAGRWLLQYGLLAQRSARERDAGPSASG